MEDIFLSYSQKDGERAARFADWLAAQGWSVMWDQTIPPGQKWAEVIERQLGAARCVIVLWSIDSVKSDWVKTEAAEAVRRRVLVPVLIDRVDIPLEFRRVQALDLSGWDLREDTPRLDLLRAAVAGLIEQQLPTSTQAHPKATARRSARVLVASLVACLSLAAVAIYFSDVWRGSAAQTAARSESLRRDVLRKADEDSSYWPYFLEEGGQAVLEQAVLLGVESVRRGGGEAAVAALQRAALLIPRPVREFAHKTQVTAVAISPDGKLLATGTEGDGSGVWDVESARLVARVPTSDDVEDIVFSSDGKRLATSGRDGVVTLWSASSGQQIATIKHPEGLVRRVLFTPDGQNLITLETKTVHVWSLSEGREVQKLQHEHHIQDAQLSRDGRYLVTSASHMDVAPVSVWEVRSGKLVASLDRGSGGIVSVSVGSEVVAVGRTDQVSFWRLNDWSRAGTVRASRKPGVMALGPDDALLAIGESDARYGALAVAEVRSSDSVVRILSQTKNSGIYLVHFSSDGSKLVGIGQDESAQVLDTRSGAELVRARTGTYMHQARSPAAFTRDGRYLVTAGANQARLWDTVPVVTAKEGCSQAGRNLSRPEWRTFFGDEPYRKTCPDLPAGLPESQSR